MATPPRRRKLKFTVRAAMAALAIASIPLARVIERAHWQRVAVRAVADADGRVTYDWQHPS
jgi:hypothetical protein